MSSNRFTKIGVDRLIRLEWLEKTAALVLAGNDIKTTKEILQADLQKSFRSERLDVRGSINKTITILLKTWFSVPKELKPLQYDALELLKTIPRQNHLPVHWGILMAVYPFWAGVALQVGRLLNLQGSAVAAQVQRRVREQYGERETVARRTRYVLRSYLDWGVLKETETKGMYTGGSKISIHDQKTIAWLIQALLHTRPNGSAPYKELISNPVFFSFSITQIHPDLLAAKSSHLEVHRHGLDEVLIMLKQPSLG